MKAENFENEDCLQKDSTECERYVGALNTDNRETEEMDGATLLEEILSRENLNKAFKRVKANKGAPGVDGKTIEDTRIWLKENGDELIKQIKRGKYKPQPVRRVKIPKPDGGERLLGIPTVVDRVIQQAITQKLTPIFEPLFAEGSYGFRPHRDAHMAIKKVKEYAEQGYKFAVQVDLSKYFDTINHEMLMNMVRQQVHDKRVNDLIKKFLKCGVMENGLVMRTDRGSVQGGNISPILANIYLNGFDHEMEKRGVKEVRYADDIVILAKSKRAAERLLGSCQKYLEGKLKLKMNMNKSRVVSVYSIRNFKFLGFALGKGAKGIYIRAHAKSLKKAKDTLRRLTSRSQGRNVRQVMQNVKVYIRGWVQYFSVADMKNTMRIWDEWLRRRIRCYIWKQWKRTYTRYKALKKLKVEEWRAWELAMTNKSYWRTSLSLSTVITKENLVTAGYFSILDHYEKLHSSI